MHVRLYDSLDPLKRINHAAFINDNVLYVWGGCQRDECMPSDEIWECDLDSREWVCRVINGNSPSEVIDFCGSFLNGSLYIFSGYSIVLGYNNQFFSVDLTEACYTWRNITDTKGTTPTPRSKHTCWVHKDRLIYFGGYSCKTMRQVQDMPQHSFILEETSWSTNSNAYLQCLGWTNEVVVFDTQTNTWSMPEMKGPVPYPRGHHATAVLGNRGFVCGGVDHMDLDLYSLHLETWTWTCHDLSSSRMPIGRFMHTLTPTSDHTLLLYGGFGVNEEGVSAARARSDAWQFDTLKEEWIERVDHPHHDKPRLFHSACCDEAGQVVLFGGSMECIITIDSLALMQSPLECHFSDVFVFQTQPSSLSRLCEDTIARNHTRLAQQLSWLPDRLVKDIRKRLTFFSQRHEEDTD